MSDLIDRANAILHKIENEVDPLRCALYHREAADLLPQLIKELKEFERLEAFQSDGLDLPPDYYENDS